MIHHEAVLHQQVADYLSTAYPHVIYRTDFAAGIKMTMGQAVKHKRLQHGRAYPDLTINYPNHGYHGLFIELKHPNGGAQPYLKDGVTRSNNKHCLEQWAVLDQLNKLGYCANMAVGLSQAITIIDWYLGNKNTKPTLEQLSNLRNYRIRQS